MKLKANPKSPLSQAVKASAGTAAAPQGASAHFQRSADFRQMFEVDLDRVHPRPDQPRRHFDEGELQALASSIAARGVLQPILVRKREGDEDGHYELIAGERRWRASRLAGRDRIRALVVDGDPAEIALIENIQRVDLTALEEARAIQSLMQAHDYSQSQVADILGRSRVRVNETLRILSLPADLLNAMEGEGRGLPRTLLLQIAREEDPARQRTLYQQAISGAGEKALRAARPAKANSEKSPAPPEQLDQARDYLRALTRTSLALPPVAPVRAALSEPQRARLRELRDHLNAVLGE
ncbi:ParB/RepB/Spo0J family partition protein [Niveispirillum sp. SYP-B3756]|uniref:ParB/RepB/Spo0J family partition protein n=1 Tax=Niveispirillum sp. SYP-B3756 TaxID=2662178 RepID=UPI001566A883|nr:ParB/RepB/Spo0J family partition protein [Niveispirillum sp. SYP-B3756]